MQTTKSKSVEDLFENYYKELSEVKFLNRFGIADSELINVARKFLVALSSGDLTKALHLCKSCIKTVVVIGESNLGNVQCPGITPLTHIYPHINRSHYSFYSTCRLAG